MRLRGLMIGVALLAPMLALSACGKSDDEDAEGFIPPTIQTRADFDATLDARFRRLDRNTDGAIDKSELPRRNPARVAAYDIDHDGRITRTEFLRGAQARFDQADANHDGSVTTEERRKIGWLGRN